MAVTQTTYNGKAYSHNSFKLRFLGIALAGVTELSWKPMISRSEVRGFSRKPLGFTEGEVSFEASMKVHYREWGLIKQELRDRGVNPLDASGTISISIEQPGLPSEYVDIKIVGVKEADTQTSSGNEAVQVTLPLDVIDVLENGVSVVSER